MVSDTLSDQLRRIGLVPAIAVALAAALATFAGLRQIVPAGSSHAPLLTLTPELHRIVPNQPGLASSGADPLASSYSSYQRRQLAVSKSELDFAKAQDRRELELIQKEARTRSSEAARPTRVIVVRRSASTAPRSSRHTSSGGAPIDPSGR
jgi:hypothetical protein